MRQKDESLFRILLTSISYVLYVLPSRTSAFYLPGIAPVSYKFGDKVPLHVNHLTPSQSQRDNQVRSVFSFDYYRNEFHFCEPEGGAQYISESLGSILFGDRIQTSPFDLHMGKDETCKSLCRPQTFEPKDAKFVNRRIWQNYNINWLVDGLPAGQLQLDPDTDTKFYSPGFMLGELRDEQAILHNHFRVHIEYHKAGQDQYRVVGILVEPSSRKESRYVEDGKAECGDLEGQSTPITLSEKASTEVTWTYDVRWVSSTTSFATRWDKYLHVFDPKIHWLSLINSAVIVTFLIGTVSTILIRTLKKDIARYNRLDQFSLDDFGGNSMDDGVQEDSGWKLVHGDVFRPPKYPLILAVIVGNGAQLLMMAGFTIAFALMGFLSPSNRGSLATVMVLLYTIFGFIGGYVSSRVYKAFHGDAWKRLFALTPAVLPAIVFATFFLLNLFVWARASSGAVPFTTMLVLVLIWFVISVPLSIAGSWLGFRTAEPPTPTKTNQIPRQVPPVQGWLRPIPSMLLAGVCPFFAIFVELYFIMNSIWFSKVYYMFGFLFICYGLMFMTSAAVAIIMIYFLLCAENYRWQWRSFVTSGASAGYVFASAMLYWMRTMSFTSWTSGVLYLGYSALISGLFFVLNGTIGFLASWIFVHQIYGSLKVD